MFSKLSICTTCDCMLKF